MQVPKFAAQGREQQSLHDAIEAQCTVSGDVGLFGEVGRHRSSVLAKVSCPA